MSFFKEYVNSTGGCRRKGKPIKRHELTVFHDRNCRDRCDKDSSCTGYLLPRNAAHFWCATYNSVGLTGNGREHYECWMKGKQ